MVRKKSGEFFADFTFFTRYVVSFELSLHPFVIGIFVFRHMYTIRASG